MKLQCACGAKYAFDITPEMAEKPVRFVCQQCGLDSSDFVNRLIQQELGLAAPAAAGSLRVSSDAAPTPPPPPPVAAAPRLTGAKPPPCAKHPGERCTERCVVCGKPICPKCMELFGYVCSPLCNARAEAQKIHVPVYAGQKSVAEAQFWRKAGVTFGAVAVVMVALLGFWFWYAWFGSYPKPVFSVRFDNPAYAGASKLCGRDQLVFLHGGTLARYDLGSGKQIWSDELINRQQVVAELSQAEAMWQAAEARAHGQTPPTTLPTPDDNITQLAMAGAEGELQLFAAASNVWVGTPDKLTHYDWDSGKVLQEIPLTGTYGEIIPQGGELKLHGMNLAGQETLMSVNLATGESHTDEVGGPMTAGFAARGVLGAVALASARNNGSSSDAGLPLVPGMDMNAPMDPGKVAQQAQDLPLPARIALPALIASSMHQEQIMKEADEDDTESKGTPPPWAAALAYTNDPHAEHNSLISSEYGSVQMSTRLLEKRMVAHDAMKAPPAKSALDNANLNVSQTGDAANELLNQMQRDKGANTVTENQSLYQVTLSHLDSTGTTDWVGQVAGPPAVYSLKTVNVLAAGTTIIVFDKTNKKLWQATLANTMAGGDATDSFARETSRFGEGPCVERGNTLYVFDRAMLTAFDPVTGNARWRLPSVGIVGLFFDEHGMLYANSTTASPENIKFSRQIDINQKIEDILVKVDPKNGKILWSSSPGGFISYISGKYIYALYINSPTAYEISRANTAGITPPSPFVHIRRINPQNGEIIWDYFDRNRAPLDVEFNGNVIQMVFKKEVQVLKFVSL
ncbi:MAG: PQQ-binding-like beta-propeller repeat protein [Verrucomicrobiota bacterium]|jgi:hypothetical protein